MMKKKFQFYKNIILVVASALTLVAVTFAWFSTPQTNGVNSIGGRTGNELIYVDFYEKNGTGNYQNMNGDIVLDNIAGGDFNQYRFDVRLNTTDKLKLSFAIDGLPSNMAPALKDAVCIKYELKKQNKTVKNKVVTYTDGDTVTSSVTSINPTGYVKLSELTDGKIMSGFSVGDYQTQGTDRFVLYYEIGLSAGAEDVQNLHSDLGTVNLTATLAS